MAAPTARDHAFTTMPATLHQAASSGPATSSGAVTGTGIPDGAMLQAGDLGGAKPYPVGADSWPKIRPPRPCGLRVAKPSADRAVSAVVDVDQAPIVILEYVARYHTERAARGYLTGLRKSLRNCDDKSWKLVASEPNRLVLRWTTRWEHVDQQITHHTFMVLARTGPTIVLVADAGWETSSGSRARPDQLITRALRRASTPH